MSMIEDPLRVPLTPDLARQLSEEGVVVLWRDGPDRGAREGLACVLSVCPQEDCACRSVYVDGFEIPAHASAFCWAAGEVNLEWPGEPDPAFDPPEPRLCAIVDPDTGEAEAETHPDLADETDPALLDWLRAELDGALLEVLHRFRTRGKGEPPEGPADDIDLDAVAADHLIGVDELLEGIRSDEYLVDGHRYWISLFLCPDPGCDCHEALLVFFDDELEVGEGDDVGAVRLDFGGAAGVRVTDRELGIGPASLRDELWRRFQARHEVRSLLRRREAQFKVVGSTLQVPAPQPARPAVKVGRNAPCPCGSGRKYKKCCLG
jgi:hypothetical protein